MDAILATAYDIIDPYLSVSLEQGILNKLGGRVHSQGD